MLLYSKFKYLEEKLLHMFGSLLASSRIITKEFSNFCRKHSHSPWLSTTLRHSALELCSLNPKRCLTSSYASQKITID
jgi:hypothetical protein